MSKFEEDVRKYSDYEKRFDSPVRQELAMGDPREAIRKIAGAYRVARNFRRKFDEGIGVPRYQPVVKALAAYMPGRIDSIEAVMRLRDELRTIYDRDVLSASSKFLWFAWGRDVIIYDSQALRTLRTRGANLQTKDYCAFCDAWKALFSRSLEEIVNECAKQGVSSERWFCERVFDWHLWRSGK